MSEPQEKIVLDTNEDGDNTVTATISHGEECPITPIECVDVAGVPTDVIHLRAPNGTGKALPTILVVTGNPGLIGYYTPFMKSLQVNAGGNHDVIGVSFAGHLSTRNKMDASRLYTLEDQIQHKRDFLQYLQQEKGCTKGFVVLAHSIGSYIMMQVMHRWSDHNIKHLVCLFPCYTDFPKNVPRNVKVMMNPAVREVVAGFSGLLGSLPRGLKRGIFKHMMSLSSHAAECTTHGLSRATSRNVLYLARHEHDTLHDLPRDVIEGQADKLTFYFGQEDTWSPMEQAVQLQETWPHVKVQIDELGIPHAFCVHHWEETAKIAHDLINEHL